MQWRKGFVSIATYDQGEPTVPAILCGGLAVHRGYDTPRMWYVTHVQSGRVIPFFPGLRTQKEAKQAAEELLVCFEGFWWHTLLHIVDTCKASPSMMSCIADITGWKHKSHYARGEASNQ